jgi:carbon monoxide dehydrogenase subunit G
MALKMQGNITVDAPREQVWNLLFDMQFLQQVINKIPGITVEKIVQVADDKYEATATMGVAMVKGKYAGTISVIEKRAPEFVKFRGDGKGSGNWTSGEMGLTLTDQGGKTLLTYDGSGNVSGALASVGQRLIDTVGKQFIQHGTKAFAEEIAARTRAKQGAAQKPAVE